LRSIGELIRMESRHNETRLKALFADIDAMKLQLDALPRVVAEMIAAAPPRRRKKVNLGVAPGHPLSWLSKTASPRVVAAEI
jgi:hypothetical protein